MKEYSINPVTQKVEVREKQSASEPPVALRRLVMPRCKQQLDKVRTLAIKLFEAGEAEKSKQPKYIWGETRQWRDLPSESVAVWDAVAMCAYRQLKGHNAEVSGQPPGE